MIENFASLQRKSNSASVLFLEAAAKLQ